ncbi:hypothetical protein N8480_07715 [Flavobacteriaceae bacterium]|jgi:hypothetical protein|nr:hypothetical protein [Flavobacteriaceae bacterium]MDC1540537.1 hypothetical protein [Flavobacteriaceae bacterium]
MKVLCINIHTAKMTLYTLMFCSLLTCAEKITPPTDIELSKELLSGNLNGLGQDFKVWKIDSMAIDNVGQTLTNSQLRYFQQFDALGTWSDYDGLNGIWEMPNKNTLNVTTNNKIMEYYDVNIMSFKLTMKRQAESQTLEYFYNIEN